MVFFSKIFFFTVSGVFGYYVVDSFYSQPINNELINEVYYLKAEILKKEEELAIKKEAEKNKIDQTENQQEREKLNEENQEKEVVFDNIPDPVIDNLWLTCLSYAFYGLLTGGIINCGLEEEDEDPWIPLLTHYFDILFDIIYFFVPQKEGRVATFLTASFFTFILVFFFKIISSLFSSLVFKTHGFWWNLSESYNLKFYFKSWFDFGVFLLNIALFGFICYFIWDDSDDDDDDYDD